MLLFSFSSKTDAQNVQKLNATASEGKKTVDKESNSFFESVSFGIYPDNRRSKVGIESTGFQASSSSRDTSYMNIGGAVRFNFVYTDYENGTSPLGTANRNEWTWDTWRLNLEGLSKGVRFSFEYRFYPAFNSHFIHHGWLGYDFSNDLTVKMGVHQVPFGMQPFVSHSWWFQLPYYVGLEDDYDMGFKAVKRLDQLTLSLAYYLNSEPRGTSEAGFGAFSAARYSYDVIQVEGNSNRERNQVNGRIAYDLNNGQVGLSAQYTQIANLATEENGDQLAFAAHWDQSLGRWNLKSQVIYYRFDGVEDDAGTPLNVVQMGAYGFGSYDVAAEATLYSVGLSYTLPLDVGPISSIEFYNDYSLMDKNAALSLGNTETAFTNSQQNVLGALITAADRIYMYVDLAMGYNHPWLTNSFGGASLGTGKAVDYANPAGLLNPIDPNPDWNFRFNINLGYYF